MRIIVINRKTLEYLTGIASNRFKTVIAHLNIRRRRDVSRRDFLKMMFALALGYFLIRLPHGFSRTFTKRALAQITAQSEAEYNYLVYVADITYEAKNLSTGAVDYSNASPDIVINKALESA